MSRGLRSSGTFTRPPSYLKMADSLTPHELLGVCDDCGATSPSWVSINRGVLICSECCSIHRSLGRHISRVKALNSHSWSPTLKEMVLLLARKGVNAMWEYCLHHSTPGFKTKLKKISQKDRLHPTKYDFIVAKYKHLSFIPKLTRDKDSRNSQEDLSRQLHACTRTSNLETCLRLIALGADPNYMHPERGCTPLHVAALAGETMQVELLIVQGADPCILDRLGHTPDECARIAGHHNLADRIIECQYGVTDRLSYFLFGRNPAHSSGEHFLLPSNLTTSECEVSMRTRLSELDNPALEDLACDVFDEIDRRENDASWLTTQQLESLVAFLPVNQTLSPLRNQARQKLATLDKSQFSQIIIDILNECFNRQKRSMLGGVPGSGRLVPSGGSDMEMMEISHDYDEVPNELEEESEISSKDSGVSSEVKTDSTQPEDYAAVVLKLQKSEAGLKEARQQNKDLSQQVRDLIIEVEKLKDMNAQLNKQMSSSIGVRMRRQEVTHSMPSASMPPIPEPPTNESSRENSTEPIDPYMTVSAAREEVEVAKKLQEDQSMSSSKPYSKVNMELKQRLRQLRGEGTSVNGPKRDPTFSQIDQGIGSLIRVIQGLLEAAQKQETHRFSVCCESVTNCVLDVVALFPPLPVKGPVTELVEGLVTASYHLKQDHFTNKAQSIDYHIQQIITSAYDVVKAARSLLVKAEEVYKH